MTHSIVDASTNASFSEAFLELFILLVMMFCSFYRDARVWMNAQITRSKDDSLFVRISRESKMVPNDNILGNQCLE